MDSPIYRKKSKKKKKKRAETCPAVPNGPNVPAGPLLGRSAVPGLAPRHAGRPGTARIAGVPNGPCRKRAGPGRNVWPAIVLIHLVRARARATERSTFFFFVITLPRLCHCSRLAGPGLTGPGLTGKEKKRLPGHPSSLLHRRRRRPGLTVFSSVHQLRSRIRRPRRSCGVFPSSSGDANA